MPASRGTQLVRLALLVATCAPLAAGQVTFSRDWNAGKRDDATKRCAPPAQATAALRDVIVKYLGHITYCHLKSFTGDHYEDNDSVQRLFDDFDRGK
ncbi:adipokinetic hormone/corazonin-related peptide-like [Bacillus rossius redtenbacheri]|uniref:adipokinetic hormone/corazonin-related peptide-like n=1 Tax=Bacillus rossius redtenbacheri TaxID=93214 RepID=UPI002FDE4506